MNRTIQFLVPVVRRLVSGTVLLVPLWLALAAGVALADHPDRHGPYAREQVAPHGLLPAPRPARSHGYRGAYPPVVYVPVPVYGPPGRGYPRGHGVTAHRSHRGGHYHGCGHYAQAPAHYGSSGSVGLWVDGVWIGIGAHRR